MEHDNPERTPDLAELLGDIYDGAIFVSETLPLLRPGRQSESAERLLPITMLWHAKLFRNLQLYEGFSAFRRHQASPDMELAVAYLVHRAPFGLDDVAGITGLHPGEEEAGSISAHPSALQEYQRWLGDDAGEPEWEGSEPMRTSRACHLLRVALSTR